MCYVSSVPSLTKILHAKSQISSNTNFVRKHIQILFSEVINYKKQLSAKKTTITEFCFSCLIFLFSLLVGNDTHRIMVGCPSSTYPSIRTTNCADSQDHGGFPVVHISAHSHNNMRMWCAPWSAQQELWARPSVRTPALSEATATLV